MLYRLDNLILPPEHDSSDVKKAAAKKLGCSVCEYVIIKKSLDARRGRVRYCYSLAVETSAKTAKLNGLKPYEEPPEIKLSSGSIPLSDPPVIVGGGPCGLFCAYILACHGFRPVLLERGSDVDQRTAKVSRFFRNKILDENTNIQFGAGGAGTFSDGKLTTRINDPRSFNVLKIFVQNGAPKDILYLGKPHIGTDNLKKVIKNLVRSIEKKGGSVLFDHKADNLKITCGRLKSVQTQKASFDTQVAVLAIGHSARDTYKMLYAKGLPMKVKPFAVGVRIEHKRNFIDRAQCGAYAGADAKSLDYSLSVIQRGSRACFSFCPCPGGFVIASASEDGTIVTNGMSNYKRDAENTNSALLVSVGPRDFGTNVFDGAVFQQSLEKAAFINGGSDYCAPVQLAEDFLNNKKTTNLGSVKPSYPHGWRLCSLSDFIPHFVTTSLAEGIRCFGSKIKYFDRGGAVLTGVETRSSAPLKILRDDNRLSPGFSGIYPSGEGAGYAGGIMSAAVDGIKTAEAIIKRYYPVY